MLFLDCEKAGKGDSYMEILHILGGGRKSCGDIAQLKKKNQSSSSNLAKTL